MENEFSTDFGEMECDHLIELKRYLKSNKLSIYGVINVHCEECSMTYVTELTDI